MQERYRELQERRNLLKSKQEVLICRTNALAFHEKQLEGSLGRLLENKEHVSELQLNIESRSEKLELLKATLKEKNEMLVSKKKQLHQRKLEVKNTKALLEDAVAEKHESMMNHIVYHSREALDIKQLCSTLPSTDLRLSMVCKEQLDQIGTMKNRQAGIYAVDLQPSSSVFVQVQHLKKSVNKQKRKNLVLFNRIKQLHQKSIVDVL